MAREFGWQFSLIWVPCQAIPTWSPLCHPTQVVKQLCSPSQLLSIAPGLPLPFRKSGQVTGQLQGQAYGTDEQQSPVTSPAQQQSPTYGPVQLPKQVCHHLLRSLASELPQSEIIELHPMGGTWRATLPNNRAVSTHPQTQDTARDPSKPECGQKLPNSRTQTVA